MDFESSHDCEIEKQNILRKLDLHLLLILSILYLLSYLNGTNIANAKLLNLEHDIQLTSEQYQWCLSIYFVGFIIFQIPSNIVLRRCQPSSWISFIVLLWGLTAISMAAVYSFETLLLARFLLGIFQCGFFPGFIYYISLWYRRKEQAIRLGFFWSFSALAGAFGGYIAYSIAQINSSTLTGWQLIFLIEGFPTVILAIVCWHCLPDSPEQAQFLNSKQRQLQLNRLAQDAGASHTDSFSWAQVLSVFVDWKTYAYATIYICGTISLQGVTLFLPTLISELGHWSPIQTQLMTVPPYLAAFIAILIVSHSSDYFVERSFHLIFTNLLTISGLLLLMFTDEKYIYVLYMAISLVMCGTYSNVSVRVAWINNNFASLTRRAVASAFIISIAAIGGVISGQMYNSQQKPRFFLGHSLVLSFIILQTISILVLRLIFMCINRQRLAMNDQEIAKRIKKYGGDEHAGDYHPHYQYTL